MVTVAAFPTVRIGTDRLIIREFEPGDAASVVDVIAAREWEALPPRAPRQPAGVPRWLGADVHRFRTRGYGMHLAIQESLTGVHVGAISLFNTDWKRGCTEVGFGIRARMRMRGYVTEALSALTGWVLCDGGMRDVELLTNPANVAARRVAEKTGYICVGVVADPLSGADMLLFKQSRRPLP